MTAIKVFCMRCLILEQRVIEVFVSMRIIWANTLSANMVRLRILILHQSLRRFWPEINRPEVLV